MVEKWNPHGFIKKYKSKNMVISKTYNFIFLRLPKNASTSLAAFFVENCCGADDIYTYIGNAKISTRNVPPDVCKNYKKDHRIIHLTLQEIVDSGVVDAEFAMNAKTIAVLRNPLERQLSLFFFLSKEFKKFDTSIKSFRKEFSNGCHITDPSNAITQYDYCVLNGKNLGTYWLYENINEKLDSFVQENNIKVKNGLQQYKSNYRSRKDTDNLIKEYYDEATRRAVENYYSKDFELYESLKNEN